MAQQSAEKDVLVPVVAVVKDNSSRYDPTDWWKVYVHELLASGVDAQPVDLSSSKWLSAIAELNPSAILWRVWHRPDDLRDALTKIHILQEETQVACFPSTRDLWSYNDKVRQLHLGRRVNLPFPKTIATRQRNEAKEFAAEVGFPLVAKAPCGASGTNVWLIRTALELGQHLDQVFSTEGLRLHDPVERQRGIVYLQRFEARNRDLRVIVVGSEIALAFWRSSAGWKHNVGQGARIDPFGVPAEALKTCLSATASLGFPWCAFDLIEGPDNFFVLEFSVQFGFSSPDQYREHFGSWDGGVLARQAALVAKVAKCSVH